MDKQFLAGLLKDGLTRDEIAKRVGRNRSFVDRWLAKFNLRKYDKDTKNRRCRGCGKQLPLDVFPGEICRNNGKFYRRWLCQGCYVQSKTDYKLEIADWLERLKKQNKCVECGESDHRLLDFHHRNGSGDKAFNISEAPRRFCKKKILSEIAKCDVMCVKCHRILTYEERKQKEREYRAAKLAGKPIKWYLKNN